jgi:threonine dehydrogenase-like Zn-dependent dehydrogenase
MRAIRFNASIPRYAVTFPLGRIRKEAYYKGPMSTTYMDDVPEPELFNDNWVKVRTTYGGVCGSDINLIFLKDSPYSEPFATMPFTVGHENVGRIVEIGSGVDGFEAGDRVVVDPMMPCAAREIDPVCDSCARGDYSQCLNLRKGDIPPGFYTGLGAPSGGSWSEFFVAHKTQLFKVPDTMSDEQAVMLEALAICVHSVMRNLPEAGQTVLIYGCGAIGMLTAASLKALAPECRLIVIARYPFQAEVVRRYGVDEIIMQREVDDVYAEVAGLTGAEILKPMIGPRYLNGGPETVFECVGSSGTVNDALRMTKSGGRVVMVGLITFAPGIDWTPVWFKELTINGSLCSSTDTYRGETKRSFEWAKELVAEGKIDVDGLVTHIWELDQFVQMIETATSKGGTGCIKQAFKF